MTILRVRSTWQNWPGAPGVTDFYSQDLIAANFVNDVRAFFDAIKANLPSGLQVQTSGVCDLINEVNGQLVGQDTTATPAVVQGTNAGVYSGASGAVIRWTTGGFVAGRRVQGRTFLVPLVGQGDTNGSIISAVLTTLQTAADGLITAGAGDMVVWSRPRQFIGGSSHIVTGRVVPDLAAVLRSRRT